MSLAPWPGFRAIGLILMWILAVFVVFAWRAYWRLPQGAEEGVVAFRFDVTKPALFAFLPPLLFFGGYALFRRRSEKR